MDNEKFSYIDPRSYRLCPGYYIRHLPDTVHTFPKGPCPRCDFVNEEGENTIATSIQNLVGQDCWGISILHTDESAVKPYRTFLYAHYQDGGYVNRYKKYDDDVDPFEFINNYRTLVCFGSSGCIPRLPNPEETVSCIKTMILQYMRPGDILELWMFQCDGFMVEYHNLHQNLSSTVEHGFNNGDVKVNYCKDYVSIYNPCVCFGLTSEDGDAAVDSE